MTIGENIKMLRKYNMLNQKQFAERMGTTQQRVSEWETNKIEPSLYNVIKMLKVLGVTFEELTDGVEEEE
ncbi:MAG: helix-turn-helix domain-containing protein [Acutalibacteraceae bacterium]|jgi:transcriptional regulator with XRE-family HTH domain